MYLCYVDESGTPDVPGNTSHYVLAGVSIPVQSWKSCDAAINTIKARYDLTDKEIHIAWLLRSYPEQRKIKNFEQLSHSQRVQSMTAMRNAELLRLQRTKNPAQYKQTRTNFKKTADYIHLSMDQRRQLILDVAQTLASWGSARLFAECIDKIHFDPNRAGKSADEQAFEQVVSRLEQYLQAIAGNTQPHFGVLIHDNNETVAKRHTQLMKKFHQSGTLWTNVTHIIETPLFVNSELTGMVQIADLCAYALRRYLENGEQQLFDIVFRRADRRNSVVVGVRHFTQATCSCAICASHRRIAGS